MEETKMFLDFLKKGTSPFHVVEQCCQILEENQFTQLEFDQSWQLEPGKSYYTKPYGTTMFAFHIGEDVKNDGSFHIASSHTDYPCFRVKPNADMQTKGYRKVNVESYGGLVLGSWQDRPLSIAGKVCLKSDDVFQVQTKLVDFVKPVATIPSLAIHMNREVNKGVELKKQTQLLPLLAMKKSEDLCRNEESSDDVLNSERNQNSVFPEKDYLLHCLAKKLGVEIADILDFDLYVYQTEEGQVVGMEDDFISAPRLDNLTSVYALLQGILKKDWTTKENKGQIGLAAFYDNEEIGSRSKQGADSSLTSILLEKIYEGLSFSRAELRNAIMKSFHLCVDVAHCLHPNYAEKNDPTNQTELGKGVVLKLDSTQKYAYDTEAVAGVMQLCQKYNLPCQKFVNHSDGTSGSTLGSIASSWLPMKTVDLGVPLLAMHSARELMAVVDEEVLCRLMENFL